MSKSLRDLLLDDLCNKLTTQKVVELPNSIFIVIPHQKPVEIIEGKVDRSKKDTNTIVYDSERLSSPLSYPDNYYCNTYQELLDIMIFMINNYNLYNNNTNPDDVMENNIELLTSFEDRSDNDITVYDTYDIM